MHLIKLNATDSTNSYLRRLSANESIENFTTVIAEKQLNGKGQMGAVWSSQSAKNLTCSVFIDMSEFKLEHTFYISIATSLAIFKTLQFYFISRLSVKWPNDILSEEKKVCGILIENVIKQNEIKGTIIGIGLNVNQSEFKNLPNAASLKMISGKIYDLDEVLNVIINNLKDYFKLLKARKYKTLKDEYERHLFRKDKPSTFRDAGGFIFPGFIKGVTESGNLNVLLEDEVKREFDLKEITLLY
ncbi:MAG: biotin--[acetyl-CoA-carboxylase] ligase [Flaviramulus sp.]|nr:biotin--[acetyl-CoA-carboxylase] ligase [Flaviramulus sp.]NNC49810.1 biotin--[acetyl-CoA-carboxylase] ligase [Flaviramulus sp.]